MSATRTAQKAIIVSAPGDAYVVGESTIPKPAPQDVLVKLYPVGLNPIDWKISLPAYAAMAPAYPFIPGTDGAGVVAEVGEGVDSFKIGDRV